MQSNCYFPAVHPSPALRTRTRRFSLLAAQRTGKLLNQADLARDATLTHPTTHRYLNLLEAGCLVTRIRPAATNPSAALAKAPKLLWTDCGRAAWLAGIKSSADATQRLDVGFLVGANPVSDSGHLARPRFTTAQAAFLAGPCHLGTRESPSGHLWSHS